MSTTNKEIVQPQIHMTYVYTYLLQSQARYEETKASREPQNEWQHMVLDSKSRYK